MSSCSEQFCRAVGDLLDTNSNNCTLNPEPQGTDKFCSFMCVSLRVSPAHSHIEEVESYAVEAFAVCVCGQRWRAAGSWVLAAVPGQRDDQSLQGLGARPSGDLLRMSVVVLLVLGVNLSRLLVGLGRGGDRGGSRGRSGGGAALPLHHTSTWNWHGRTPPRSWIDHFQLLAGRWCRKLWLV